MTMAPVVRRLPTFSELPVTLCARRLKTGAWRSANRSARLPALWEKGTARTMTLAERGTFMGNENPIWVKEVRKLTDSGHQTSMVTTAKSLEMEAVAPAMFTRWCQENFFGYATKHFPKEQKKGECKHIRWDELGEEDKFMRMPQSRRLLVNTLAMIAYRAETAMASIMHGTSGITFSRARSILQALFVRPADIVPDKVAGTLNIHVHAAATRSENMKLAALLGELNATETFFPLTKLRMVFGLYQDAGIPTQMVPLQLPRGKEI